jgi:hypothetical protein
MKEQDGREKAAGRYSDVFRRGREGKSLGGGAGAGLE